MNTYCKNITLEWVEVKPGYFIEQCFCKRCLRKKCLFRKPEIYNKKQSE